jgi:molybdate transport system regulatory protein
LKVAGTRGPTAKGTASSMNIWIKGELSVELECGLRINPRLLDVLRLVEETGSLNTAVGELGLSYSYVWNSFYKINCLLNDPIIITKRGGKGGGTAELTESGKKLLRQYEKTKKEFDEFLTSHKIVF